MLGGGSYGCPRPGVSDHADRDHRHFELLEPESIAGTSGAPPAGRGDQPALVIAVTVGRRVGVAISEAAEVIRAALHRSRFRIGFTLTIKGVRMMRKLILIVGAVGMLVVPSTAVAKRHHHHQLSADITAVTGNATCIDGRYAGTIVATNVTVPAGAKCDLSWADVKGNVSVQGTLTSYGATKFEKNVSVVGGQFGTANWAIEIDGNLSFLDPAAGSYNGFWGNYGGINLVKGNMSYTIDSATAYPCYSSPLLYGGGGVQVNGNFSYTDNGIGQAGHFDQDFATNGFSVTGSKTVTITAVNNC
jgi:hypothetical protein